MQDGYSIYVITFGPLNSHPGVPIFPCFLLMALFYYVLSFLSFVSFYLPLYLISPVYSELDSFETLPVRSIHLVL